jgi:hypothetical protein
MEFELSINIKFDNIIFGEKFNSNILYYIIELTDIIDNNKCENYD